jgi:hypothetical protein
MKPTPFINCVPADEWQEIYHGAEVHAKAQRRSTKTAKNGPDPFAPFALLCGFAKNPPLRETFHPGP